MSPLWMGLMVAPEILYYLDRYAEPVIREVQAVLPSMLARAYQYVLVIPLFDEALDCLETILPADLQDTLIILVVNAAMDAGPLAIANTQAFLHQFCPQGAGPLTRVETAQHNSSLLILDCCSPKRQLPAKQGVGLARKLGGDLALACMAQGRVVMPWIHCTDGDVSLPTGYFATSDLGANVAVALYPFGHQPQHSAICQYEISLRYYVIQLARAQSPYAYHSIGSLLKINAVHYAKVRGFPRRRAAEDFYMLNKLAKTGPVIRLSAPEVLLSSRPSGRVPFGTGAAMTRLAQGEPLLLYHPQIFGQLQHWLRMIDRLWLAAPRPGLVSRSVLDPEGWQARILGEPLRQTLLALGADQALNQAYRQCRDLAHFQFFMAVWFDAFRTLKFVHYQRDHYWPSLQIAEAIALTHKPALNLSLPQILEYLRSQETQLPREIGPTLFQSARR